MKRRRRAQQQQLTVRNIHKGSFAWHLCLRAPSEKQRAAKTRMTNRECALVHASPAGAYISRALCGHRESAFFIYIRNPPPQCEFPKRGFTDALQENRVSDGIATDAVVTTTCYYYYIVFFMISAGAAAPLPI